MITINNIDKSFKPGKNVLNELSLDINEGECCGLVGLNGAGKTTLLRLILGLYKPDVGTIDVFHKNPRTFSSDDYKKIGTYLESDGFHGNLSFRENLLFFGIVKGLEPDSIVAYGYELWKPLMEKKEAVKNFSRGQKVMCGLARTFLGDSELYIFDEPTATLDMAGQQKFSELILKKKEEGATILISSHRLETIESLCDTVAHLKNGTIYKRELNDASRRWIFEVDSPKLTSEIMTHLKLQPEVIDETSSVIAGIPTRDDVSAVLTKLIFEGIRVYSLKEWHVTRDLMEAE